MKRIYFLVTFMFTIFAFHPLFAEFISTTENGDVIVTDTKTVGLIWQQTYAENKTWQEALDYCENLTYAGYSDWRLPNINELASLINYARKSPASDFPGFTWVIYDKIYNTFVSSSTYQGYYFWTVSFEYGVVTTDNKTSARYYVRCVRSGKIGDIDEIPDDDDETPDEISDMDEIDDSDSLPTHYTLGNICTGQGSCSNASSSMICPTSSIDNFYGQDAQYTSKCVAQSFTAGTGVQTGTVIDNNTGLTWEKSPSSSTYNWDDAPNHCTELNSSNYGGKNNWRVPNPLEFMTIVSSGKYNPATNSKFTNMPTENSTYLWTSKEYKGDTSYAYCFSPSYGHYGYNTKSTSYKVLCVSGDEMQPATLDNFTTQTINGKVVVTDSKTGLIWQKEYDATGKTWQQALKYCESLVYAGYDDWRLPNKNEAASLLNYDKSAAPYSDFPDMSSNSFWSSTTMVGGVDATGVWEVNFYIGFIIKNTNSSHSTVRCVRNAD